MFSVVILARLPFIIWLLNLKLVKKPKRRYHVLTGKELGTGARLEYSSRKPLANLAQQADISVSSTRTATKLFKLHPYKMTYMHSLQPRDPAKNIHFYKWFIQSVNEGTLDPQLLFLLTPPCLLKWKCECIISDTGPAKTLSVLHEVQIHAFNAAINDMFGGGVIEGLCPACSPGLMLERQSVWTVTRTLK